MTVTTTGDNPFSPGMVSEIYQPDQLIAGRYPQVTDTVTITGAAKFVRGTLLGVITANGKYTIATSAANDGSQNPIAILADTVDATAADVTGGIYLAGEFNTNAMTFGTGITAAAAKAALRDANIYLKAAVSAADPS